MKAVLLPGMGNEDWRKAGISGRFFDEDCLEQIPGQGCKLIA
jgi:hypothetical protein